MIESTWLVLRLAVTFCLLASLSRPSGAQVAPDKSPAVLWSEGLHEFRACLEDISREDHVGFVVEGEPQPVVLLERAAKDSALPSTLPPQGGTVSIRERVNSVAASYDYTASRVGSLFLFRKKHTFPADIPDVTPEECYMASVEMREMLESLSHTFVPHEQTQLLDSLVSSLTPYQWHIMETTHYLRTQGDLSVDQRNMLLSFVLHTYSIPGLQFANFPSLLNPDRLPCFSRGDSIDGSRRQIGIKTTNVYGSVHRVDFFPIASAIDSGSDRITTEAEKLVESDSISGEPAFHIATTIGSAVEDLNKRRLTEPPNSSGSRLKFSVASTFAPKPVTLVGESIAAPADVARAIASVYGLGLQRSLDKPDIQEIRHFPLPKMEHPSDAGLIAHQILPAPFLTALQVDEEDALHAMPIYSVPENEEQRDLMHRKWDRNELVFQRRLSAIRSAGRQLVAILDKLLPLVPAGPLQTAATIPLGSANAHLQTIFVMYTMKDFVMQMDGILYPPWTVSRFDQTSLTCVPDYTNPAKPVINIKVNVMETDGKQSHMGVLGTTVNLDLRQPNAAAGP